MQTLFKRLSMISASLFRFPDLPSLSRSAIYRTRTQVCVPVKIFFCRAKHDGVVNLRVVPSKVLAAEIKEAKVVLTLFLKKQGLSNVIVAKTINKSDLFIDHLISKLHSVHKSRYLVGRGLTTLEIRDAVIPYLEILFKEHGKFMVDFAENYPTRPFKENSEEKDPVKEDQAELVPTATVDTKMLRALGRVSDIGPAGKLPPNITYLIELGMDLGIIKTIIRKFPSFAYYSLDGKIRPLIKFLIDLGVPKSDIPIILSKRPQLCGMSLSKNLIPTMKFLEGFSVDKEQWPKVIYRFPALLTRSRQKMTSTVDFLYEMGLSTENVGKVLTRYPRIIGYSVEDKLRPTAVYFSGLGVNAGVLLTKCPQTFGLSISNHLKPMFEFFVERGYSIKEVGVMITGYGSLCTYSLAKNLIPKWDFFLTMCYPKSELIKFPQYFGYSLEERIKPRYAIVAGSGVKIQLSQILSLSEDKFEKIIQKKSKKMLGD